MRRTTLPAVSVLLAAGILAYANSLDGAFVLDDVHAIVENQHIRHPLQDWREIVGGPQPLLMASLALNYALVGLDPRGYHFFNVGVHLLAGLTLFGLTRRTLARTSLAADRTGLGFVIALLWLLHPLQTNCATYIVQRAESMMALFYLLTLYCFARSADREQNREDNGLFNGWTIAAVLACAMGMLCKTVMITAPVIVLLYDRAFVSGSLRTALIRHRRLYLLLAATWLIPVSQGTVSGILSPAPRAEAGAGFGVVGITAWEYARTQPGVLLHYLRLAFWPCGLCLDYQWPIASSASEIVLPATAMVVLLLFTGWAFYRNTAIGFAGVYFFLVLAPTSSFIPLRDLAFEHRMYLPLAAIVAMAAAGTRWLLARLAPGQPIGTSPRMARPPRVLLAVSAVVALALGWATHRRNQVYGSDLAVWQDIAANRPSSARAFAGWGGVLYNRQDYAEAADKFRQSLELDPRQAETHYNLACALAKLGKQEEALSQFKESLALDRQNSKSHVEMGRLLFRMGRTDEAAEHFSQALESQPDFAPAHYNLGLLLWAANRLDESTSHFAAAVRADPGFAAAHHRLGKGLMAQKKTDDAIAAYREAVRLQPDFGEAQGDLGLALAVSGRAAEAIETLRQAARLLPLDADLHCNLGTLLHQEGHLQEAAVEYRRALELRPDHAVAKRQLDSLLRETP